MVEEAEPLGAAHPGDVAVAEFGFDVGAEAGEFVDGSGGGRDGAVVAGDVAGGRDTEDGQGGAAEFGEAVADFDGGLFEFVGCGQVGFVEDG